jgi:signal transduction histidine kinase
VTVELPDDVEVPAHLEAAVFRAAREAVRNVERSARARSVAVRVAVDPGSVVLEVDDDGVGFDPAAPPRPGHIGLRTLADDADALGGTLTLASAPGRGTTLRLVLPR